MTPEELQIAIAHVKYTEPVVVLTHYLFACQLINLTFLGAVFATLAVMNKLDTWICIALVAAVVTSVASMWPGFNHIRRPRESDSERDGDCT